ncbi:MAG: hypothetical protein LBN30_07350 [Oscillospiraceae bacterium]|jgi:hypothetical protein|nr:hypothetical protein [Oscillospiraceae bacterium]
MARYAFADYDVDSVELKCLLVSRGVKADREVYRRFSREFRLDVSPLTCNCVILSDGTVVQMTDMKFHLQYLNGALSWDNLKLLRYASELGTPFRLRLLEDKPALFHEGEFVDFVTLPDYTDFYRRRTTSGLPFVGNAVLQGLDWVSFQCLWHCEYAAAGKPCQFCFSGAEFEALARKGKPMPNAVSPEDFAEIVLCALDNTTARNVQITGGSTFSGASESAHIRAYLRAINERIGRERVGDILLYITPPKDFALIDEYFALGASRIACSLEVWDEKLAAEITPGKLAFTTRKRHLDILEYAAGKFGAGSAFSNFIIGIEPFESLREGATYLAERGVIPTASVWMPMGRPVMGTMRAPNVDYYRRVIDLFGGLYAKYRLEPAGACGLNVCVERDIWRARQPAVGGGDCCERDCCE